MSEVWKDIEGYEGYYQVSNLGNVKSLPRLLSNFPNREPYYTKERIFRTPPNNKGYVVITLSRNGKPGWGIVHRMVAKAFIPNPKNKPDVNHINGVKHDNRVENLEWCTEKENVHHAIKTGLGQFYQDRIKHGALLLDECGERAVFFKSRMEASKITGLSYSAVKRSIVRDRPIKTKFGSPYDGWKFIDSNL